MSENNHKTRSERNKKQDNSNLIIKLAIGLVALLVVVFIFDFFLGGQNEDPDQIAGNSSEAETSIIIQSEESQTSESESVTSESESEESSVEESEEKEEEKEIREVPSSDPNVIRAFTGEWDPIGTTQGEPHVTDYADGSADRIEIKRATAQAMGVAENNIIENWIANNGDQKVTATITDSSTGTIYKAYLTWVPSDGWQVTRYEELQAVIR